MKTKSYNICVKLKDRKEKNRFIEIIVKTQ